MSLGLCGKAMALERNLQRLIMIKYIIKFFIFLVILFIPKLSQCAFLQISPCAELAGLSNISGLTNSPASCFYNPAVFRTDNFYFSSTYYQPFSIPDLTYKNAMLAYGYKNANMVLALQDLGNDIYKEQTALVSVNYQIIKNLKFGVNGRLLHKSISIFQNKNAYQIDIGTLMQFDKFKIFTSFSNLTFSKLDNETLPQESRTGIVYNVHGNLSTAVSFVKELDYPFSYHFAVSYKPFQIFQLNSGFQTEPNEIYGGMTVSYKFFNISYAVKNHQCLNLTHFFTIECKL